MIIQRLLAILLSFSPLVSCKLFEHVELSNNYESRGEISPELFARLELFSHYNTAANCEVNYQYNDRRPFRGKTLACLDGAPCELITKSNISIVYAFHLKVTDYQTSGIIALDHGRELTVVVIRDQLRDMNQDELVSASWIPCEGCLVRKMYSAIWLQDGGTLSEYVNWARRTYPDIVVTGHAEGGGHATMMALALRDKGWGANLFTYGAPRIGNQKLADYISSKAGSYRVTHENGKLPRMPSMKRGYRHFYPEYYMENPANVYPSINQVSVVPGVENHNGNGGNDPALLNEKDNDIFFGNIKAKIVWNVPLACRPPMHWVNGDCVY